MKALLTWKHSHAALGPDGKLVGTGTPSVTLLLRVKDARVLEHIIQNFPGFSGKCWMMVWALQPCSKPVRA